MSQALALPPDGGLRHRGGADKTQMMDSSVPLVGAQRGRGGRIDPDFMHDTLWAVRCACGVLVAALPTYLAERDGEGDCEGE